MYVKMLTDIYLVGGQEHHLVYLDWQANDANVYVINTGDTLVMIDCGCGESLPAILDNMKSAGLDVKDLSHLILTHEHYPHAAAADTIEKMGIEVVASEHTAAVMDEADRIGSGAFKYSKELVRADVAHVAEGDEILTLGRYDLRFVMLPGHSAGSMGVLATIEDQVVLFSGDTVLPPRIDARRDSIDYDAGLELSSLKRLLDEDPAVIMPGHGWPCLQHGRAWIERQLVRLLERIQSTRDWGEGLTTD